MYCTHIVKTLQKGQEICDELNQMVKDHEMVTVADYYAAISPKVLERQTYGKQWIKIGDHDLGYRIFESIYSKSEWTLPCFEAGYDKNGTPQIWATERPTFPTK